MAAEFMKLPSYAKLSVFAGRWSSRVVSGVIDQGLFSGSNFLVNILLARWLTPDGYGAFAIAFSLYLGLAGLVCSLTLEPMMVYGATDFSDKIDDYLAKVSFMHFFISGVPAGGLLVIAYFFKGETSNTIRVAACALPFMLQVWFVRRALYCTMRITQAAVVSLLYSVLLVGGISFLKAAGLISPIYIYVIFVLASLSCFMYYRVVVAVNPGASADGSNSVKMIIDRHWNFGKWLIVASAAASVSTLLYAPVLGLVSELKDVAAYKGIQNLSTPFGQMLTVFTMLMLPGMSRVVRNDPWKRVRKYIWGITIGFALAALLYGAVLILFGEQILMLLYANKFYAEYCWLIPVFAFVLVIRSINQSLATIIRAYEDTRTILIAKISSALVVFSVLIIFVPIMNLRGILLAMCLGVLTELCIVVRFFFRISYGNRAEGRGEDVVDCV